jgi:hypothetical protein
VLWKFIGQFCQCEKKLLAFHVLPYHIREYVSVLLQKGDKFETIRSIPSLQTRSQSQLYARDKRTEIISIRAINGFGSFCKSHEHCTVTIQDRVLAAWHFEGQIQGRNHLMGCADICEHFFRSQAQKMACKVENWQLLQGTLHQFLEQLCFVQTAEKRNLGV